MATPSAAPPPPPAASPIRTVRSRKPQFSLRSMMIATTVFAVVAALSTWLGNGLIFAIVIGLGAMLMVPVGLGTVAWYSRGRRQTFFFGAFIGSIGPHLVFHGLFVVTTDVWQSLALLAMQATAILVCGCTAVYARRFVERRGWDRPSRDE